MTALKAEVSGRKDRSDGTPSALAILLTPDASLRLDRSCWPWVTWVFSSLSWFTAVIACWISLA